MVDRTVFTQLIQLVVAHEKLPRFHPVGDGEGKVHRSDRAGAPPAPSVRRDW